MEFLVSFRDQKEQLHEKQPFSQLESSDLKAWTPFRRVWTTRNQRNTPGLAYFSTTHQQIYHESFLEKCILICVDFEGVATHVCEQPFRLHFEGVSHVPDFLILRERKPLLIDVRHSLFINTKGFLRARAATQMAMNELGWEYEIRSEPPKQYMQNVSCLSGFRRRPPDLERFASTILQLFEQGPQTFGQIFSAVEPEMLARPVVFHLLWQRILTMDLYAPMTLLTVVHLAGGGAE
jgi:hypothetical protein